MIRRSVYNFFPRDARTANRVLEWFKEHQIPLHQVKSLYWGTKSPVGIQDCDCTPKLCARVNFRSREITRWVNI